MAEEPKTAPELGETKPEDQQTAGAAAPTLAHHLSPLDTAKRYYDHHAPRAKALAVTLVILASLTAGFFGGWLGADRNKDEVTSTGISKQNQKVVTSESQLISAIAKNVSPSVVSVDVTAQSSSGGIFGFGGTQQDAGTGIIISSGGLIVTNRHVVPANTTKVSVTLSDGTTLNNVEVVGRTNDSDTLDIAFLKIKDAKGHKLTPATLGDSGKVQVGDMVVAIGNALGQFQNTVTSGIISGFGRDVQASDASGSANAENLADLFQTDAAINEGNSGGPLVNSSGEVIGINTAIAGNAQNIGFAIPINDVQGLIKQVIATGKFQRPYLGVKYVSLTADVAYEFNLSTNQGAYIAPTGDPAQPSVLPDSPAEKAGLQEKDIITEINGTKVDQTHSLTSLLSQKAVDDKVDLTVVRDGKTQHISVSLGVAPNSQ
jgi:serine protease Do